VESARRGGGNARYSGGFLFDVPGPAAADHLDALCFGRTGRPVLEAYAAGAVSLVWGHLIEHGGGLTDAIVFGRVAGSQAAARAASRLVPHVNG
jgi:succinate dehydrogenase/fumarate reductase flavoprotein subunit